MQPGFYGKMPIKGDFIQRRLDRGITAQWDDWLQTCMDNSRAALGDAWLNHYLVSPVWRFILAPNTVSANCFAGIVMPSVDSVGRHFPLTLAMELPADLNLMHFAIAEDNWFEQLEDLAFSTLEPQCDIETFDAALQQIGPKLPLLNAMPMAAKEGRRGWLHSGLTSTELLQAGYAQQLNNHIENGGGHWWTVGSDNITPAFVSYDRLPPASEFAAFLTGNW
ncbi:type VI secretion system-associated protein TagF [Alteromonadaceae bacterium BrNp21-10]|nr:type VI secretion system-associated protein TagF [Alteromonadaceae bacterium BrNp21-10]